MIKYLPEFNDFSNYMIDYYSYKISRDDASKRIMEKEAIFEDNSFKKKFNKFIKIWNEIKKFAIKYKGNKEMKSKDLDKDSPLACFLNDDDEFGKGIYIAAAYQNFIEWQNNFLDSLIKPLKQSGILHHFVKNMEKSIDVQKAKVNEVLNFDIVNKDFIKYIYENSKRNIFRNDNSINYRNYQRFIYDFGEIEKCLGNVLLPGKVKFNNTNSLKFVTFYFEGFRGDKSSILIDFENKYKQIPLSMENKGIIYKIIKTEYYNKNDKLSNILSSLQFFIYYLTQESYKKEEEIKIIIGELPENVLSQECIEFLKNEELKIKIEDLIDVYLFFELACFNSIKENLKDNYKEKIKKEIQDKILNLFKEKEFELITESKLASACRKFISRYLLSYRKNLEYPKDQDLIINLTMYESWPKDFIEKDDAFFNDFRQLKNKNLKVGQCYDLYKLLEGYDEELKNFEKEINQIKEKKDLDEIKENNIKRHKRNKIKY